MTDPRSDSPLFAAEGVVKRYGAVTALDGVDVSVRAGEVHGLLGENGAGKSTLIKISNGLVRADRGRLQLAGAPFAPTSVFDATHQGVRLVSQEFDLAPNITVAENLALGSVEFLESCRAGRFPWSRAQQWAAEHLERFGIPVRARTPVGDLSVSERQLVALARAVLDHPRLVFLDEPSSALDSRGVELLFDLVRTLRDQGVSVLYVSHKLEEVFHLCDRATVLRDGTTVGVRDVADTTVEEIIGLMVGRELGDLFPPRTSEPPGEVVLDLHDLHAPGVHGVSLQVRTGEILGIGGLVGAGRTELAKAVCGLAPIQHGRVRVAGAPVTIRDRPRALELGLEYVTEDRLGEGLVLQRPIAENVSMRVLDRFRRGPLVSTRAERSHAADRIGEFGIAAPGPGLPVGSLSGGNQQKTLLAGCLAADPRVVFLDEPTRGIDVGAKAQIYELVRTLAEDRAVVVISAELIELLGLADRILMMRDGRIEGEFDARTTDEETLLGAALGVEGRPIPGALLDPVTNPSSNAHHDDEDHH